MIVLRKEWEIDDAAVEELRKVLPRYPSSLARAIASEAADDFNGEHYASDANYTLAQWFDAVLNRNAQQPPMLADLAQIIDAGWKSGKSAAEVAGEILREFDGPAITPTEHQCQKCGSPTKGEEAYVDGEIWCHPCADRSEDK